MNVSVLDKTVLCHVQLFIQVIQISKLHTQTDKTKQYDKIDYNYNIVEYMR